MTRVAYLSTDPGIPFGGTKGASVHVEELTRALAARGADVLLLVARSEAGAPAPRGVTVEVLPGPGKGASVAERLAAEPDRTAWLVERLERFRADALYERLALHSVAGSAAARVLGLPHLVELNAPLPAEAARYRSLELPGEAESMERDVLDHADLVLAVSPPLAPYARERGASRVEVVPNAVALERFPEPPSSRVRDRPVAVFAGSLRPWHGVDTLVEAWALLADRAPPLLVVGDGDARPLLEGVGATVTGRVPHEEVPRLLAGADIGLAPYDRDAPDYFSPLKLFEYLAAGLATVAGDLPGVRAAVTPDSTVVVPRGDAPALAAAVLDLASDPARRLALGKAGRALVAARHTWGHRAEAVLDRVGELAREGARA